MSICIGRVRVGIYISCVYSKFYVLCCDDGSYIHSFSESSHYDNFPLIIVYEMYNFN